MQELIAICQLCWRPIEAGHLGIDTQMIAEYQAANAARSARTTDPVLLEALASSPEPPTWVTHCEDCEPNTCGYCIQVSQLRTQGDLDRWTDHLKGKTWLHFTDWTELVKKVAAGTDERLRLKKAA